MFELGMVAAAGVIAASMIWYGQANGRFSEKIVGYDGTQAPDEVSDLFRRRPRDAALVLKAWREPSLDPETEHWRVLTHRRFRILLFESPLLLLAPALASLVAVDVSILGRTGPFAYLWLGGCLLLLTLWSYRLIRVLIRYGSGQPLDRRTLVISIAGIIVASAVLAAVVLLAAWGR